MLVPHLHFCNQADSRTINAAKSGKPGHNRGIRPNTGTTHTHTVTLVSANYTTIQWFALVLSLVRRGAQPMGPYSQHLHVLMSYQSRSKRTAIVPVIPAFLKAFSAFTSLFLFDIVADTTGL